MNRRTSLAPVELRRIESDTRFRRALEAGSPPATWRTKAACLGRDPELFFPTAAEDPTPGLAVCAGCPVQGPCLATALDAGECDGVWGATTPDERRVMLRAWAVSRTQRSR